MSSKAKKMQLDSSPLARVSSLVTSMRLLSCAMMGLAVILGETVASVIITGQDALFGFMTGFLLFGVNMVLYGFVTKSDTSGQTSRKSEATFVKHNEVISFALVLASFGLLFATYLGTLTLTIALVTVAIILAYHAKMKKLGLLGNVFVGGIVGLLFIYAGFAVGGPSLLLEIFAVIAFLASTGRDIMKSSATATNDLPVSGGTGPVSIWNVNGGKQSAVCFVVAAGLSILPPLLGLVSINYLPLAVICDVGFLLTAYSMITSPTPRNAKRNATYVVLWMSFGLLAFVVGAI